MKAYKITASIERVDGYDQYQSYTSHTQTKEFYHKSYETAKRHVDLYIADCLKKGIEFKQKSISRWHGYNEHTRSSYDICIKQIDIKN